MITLMKFICNLRLDFPPLFSTPTGHGSYVIENVLFSYFSFLPFFFLSLYANGRFEISNDTQEALSSFPFPLLFYKVFVKLYG